jgi:hypothetical protein
MFVPWSDFTQIHIERPTPRCTLYFLTFVSAYAVMHLGSSFIAHRPLTRYCVQQEISQTSFQHKYISVRSFLFHFSTKKCSSYSSIHVCHTLPCETVILKSEYHSSPCPWQHVDWICNRRVSGQFKFEKQKSCQLNSSR